MGHERNKIVAENVNEYMTVIAGYTFHGFKFVFEEVNIKNRYEKFGSLSEFPTFFIYGGSITNLIGQSLKILIGRRLDMHRTISG